MYIKQKVLALKKFLLKPSIVNLKSRLTLDRSIVTPQLKYACEAFYENNQKEMKILKRSLYQ